jgi:hypothetical protein
VGTPRVQPTAKTAIHPGVHRASQVPTSAPPTPGADSGGEALLDDEIASAWQAAEYAFEAAVRSADPFQPDLQATTVEPLLGEIRQMLAQMQSDGEIATGPVHLGAPKIVTVGAEAATVTSCAWDAEIVVLAATSEPVPGILGQVEVERITSTMERTVSGWKLAEQTVEADPCAEA